MTNFLSFVGLSTCSAALAIFAVGVSILTIGLKGLRTQKPIVFQMRHIVWPLLAGLILIGMFAIGRLCEALLSPDAVMVVGLPIGGMVLLGVTLNAMAIVIAWKEFEGYTVLGTTEKSLREGLLHALHELEIPFQEVMSGIRLVEQNAHISTSTTAWLESTQLRIKPKEHGQLLAAISEALKGYYQSTEVQVNRSAFLFISCLGLVFTLVSFMLIVFIAF